MWRAVEQLRRQHARHRQATARWEQIRAQLPGRVDPAAGGLTICSVAFRAKACLDRNDLLMRRLNPGVDRPRWLLFDNNVELRETIDLTDPRFTVVRPQGRDVDMGYEHALGISELLSRVRTRFVLIQDPDCFIVMPDWIRRVPQYMDEHRLGFFGTPINPRRHNSYRYFPYMVCMFVDLARVSPKDLCFVPDVWRLPGSVAYRLRRALTRIPKAGHLFRALLTEQWKTNGWRIKEQFGRGDRVKFECALPVWDVNDTIPPGSLKRLIHDMTPGAWSPVPKQPGYCSTIGFAQTGAPDVGALGWEEFMWQGRPFAFHIGSVHGQPGRYERQLDIVLGGLPGARAARAPSQPFERVH
ncbi:MAG: hypothetical protein HY048_16150 [Acidobacteria bacterium]|nr:hypothetical protein [Acidobacteriota bacterium]